MRYGTGVALVVTAAVLWSLMGLAIRLIQDAGTWQVLFWRSAGAVPVLVALIWWRNGSLARPLRGAGLAGAIGGAGLVFAFAGAIFALQSTTVANAVFLFSASPFIAAVLGRLVLREPVRPVTWALMAVAIFGMYLMVRENLSLGAGPGTAAAFLSAAGFAVYTLALRWGRMADMLPATLLGGLFSMAVAAAVIGVTGGTLAVSWHDMAIGLAMGAALLAAGLTLYTLGSPTMRAADLTLLSNIEVLLAPVWVWLVLGETATRGTLLGGAVLLAAVVANALIGLRPVRA